MAATRACTFAGSRPSEKFGTHSISRFIVLFLVFRFLVVGVPPVVRQLWSAVWQRRPLINEAPLFLRICLRRLIKLHGGRWRGCRRCRLLLWQLRPDRP